MPKNSTAPTDGLPRELSIVVADDSSGAAVVAVSGEIDISNFGKFHAAASSALVDRSQLILDLSGVTFIDSAGVNVLVHLASHEASVQLRTPSSPVRRVIELTGLARILPVVS